MSGKASVTPPPQEPPTAHEGAPHQAPSGVQDHFMCKNRLQQYTQQLSLPLPVYQTYSEGVPHALMFRSTVLVDNTYYTSPNLFKNLKSSEQYIAKIALDALLHKIYDEVSSFIREDAIFCKAILNEYSVKMRLDLPTYQTTQRQGVLPAFTSSLVFKGVTFNGQVARSKKEAEYLAARAAILSIMDNPSPDNMIIHAIIKSKYQPYADLMKANGSNNVPNVVTPMLTNGGFLSDSPLNKGKEIVNTGATSKGSSDAVIENHLGQVAKVPVPNQPFHEFNKPKLDTAIALITPPIAFVPPVDEHSLGAGSSSAKKHRRKGKKNHQLIAHGGVIPDSSLNKGKENETIGAGGNHLSSTAVIKNHLWQTASIRIVNQPFNEDKKPRIDTPTSAVTPPNMYVPPVQEQSLDARPSSLKKRRKKRKKVHQPIAQSPHHVLPTSQVPCPIP